MMRSPAEANAEAVSGGDVEIDLVIAGGTVVDGTGAPRLRADVGVDGGRIAAIARPGALGGRRTLDAAGLVVAPGFIDIHSHVDWILPLPDHDRILEPFVAQGVTTVVTGNCGHSPAPVTDESIQHVEGSSEMLRDRAFPYAWRSMGEMLETLRGQGLLVNAAFLVGHGTLREAIMGHRPDPPNAGELRALCDLCRRSLREGAVGLSAGLAYKPGVFARNDELLALLRVAAEEGASFAVHGRAFTWISPMYRPMLLTAPHNLRSARELCGLAKDSGVRLQISHQIAIGRHTWRTHGAVLRAIDRAADEGVDVAFDAFPYTAGNTTINALFPDWVLADFRRRIREERVLARLRREFALFRTFLGLDYSDITLLWGAGDAELTPLEGLDVAAIAERLGKSGFDAYIHIAQVSDGKARILIDTYSGRGEDDAPLRATLRHPLCAIETDSILTSQGVQNPASYGTFPRVLGRYCRDLGLFSLEEAVRRMTSLPAARMRLPDVGRVAPGHFADLVIFDAGKIADNTGPGRPQERPSGIHTVMISGEVVLRDGALTGGARQGRVLSSGRGP